MQTTNQLSNQTNRLNFKIFGCRSVFDADGNTNSQSGEDKSWFVSAVISSSLHNDLNTHSAATPSVHL